MSHLLAGIDVHKRVLMVVVSDAAQDPPQFAERRFGTGHGELQALRQWLQQQGVEEVVMESTAPYWKPVWQALETKFGLPLAQAQSNRAPRGRKTDFRDSRRLARRFLAGELLLSFVPAPELRLLTRRRMQLVRARVALQAQLEALLEDCGLKLSSVLTDLLGASGRRILSAIAAGESDPEQLAALGDARLQASRARLADALQGPLTELQRSVLRLALEEIAFQDRHIEAVTGLLGEALRAQQEVIARLRQVPGIRTVAA